MPLAPYEALVEEIAGTLGIEVACRRIGIRDMSIPTTEVMAEILEAIESELAAGKPVYFHCWGGIGRTGTVAACWLIEQGHSGDAALETLKVLRESVPGADRESLQTEEQKTFVRAWTPRTTGQA